MCAVHSAKASQAQKYWNKIYTVSYTKTALAFAPYILCDTPCTFRHLVHFSAVRLGSVQFSRAFAHQRNVFMCLRVCVCVCGTKLQHLCTHTVCMYERMQSNAMCVLYIVHALQSKISTLFRYLKFILISLSYASLQFKYFVVLCNGTYDYDNMVLYAHLPSLSPFIRFSPWNKWGFFRVTCSLFVSIYLCVYKYGLCIFFWLHYMHFNFISMAVVAVVYASR